MDYPAVVLVVALTPLQLQEAGHKLYGRKHWKRQLALTLGLDVSTVLRITKRERVPGPVEFAVLGLLEQKRRKDEIDRAARAMLPRSLRRRKPQKKKRKYVRKLIPYAGQELDE